MKTVLVTGGAGFIGSHFVKLLLNDGGYHVVNLDLLTYAGDLNRLTDINDKSPYTFVKGSILDSDLLEDLFKSYDFDLVVNFAAESHVDKSIEDASQFILTNVVGTQTLLDQCKKHWIDVRVRGSESDNKSIELKKKYIQISTDEVYGPYRDGEDYFDESAALKPTNPYAASKASADLMVLSYVKTFGLPAIITRCTNNFGPDQNEEKLIPKMINSAIKGQTLTLYGDGLQERTWLHVEDHCQGILKVMTNGEVGQIYNMSGNRSYTNLSVCQQIISLTQSKSQINFITDRKAHDRKYGIEDFKIRTTLGWQPQRDFFDHLEGLIKLSIKK